MKRARGAVIVVVGLAVLVVPPPARAAPRADDGRSDPRTVTLLTGDRITTWSVPGGPPAVSITPGAGRAGMGFVRDARDGRVRVIPADAVPLVAAGRLDPRLFDLAAVAAAGPGLIVAGGSPPPARVVRSLPSIGATAVVAGPGALWSWVTRPGGPSRVWLDEAALPASETRGAVARGAVARDPASSGTAGARVVGVGAPAVGARADGGPTGVEDSAGDGVAVAVLDTGIWGEHPDLAGRVVAARDFTGTGLGDEVGHGTHTAGVIAGGAPGARLLDGKVCVDFGCPASAVIAGMEWAAPQARVVALGVIAAAGDGTDPLSMAVDQLTARYRTLFVAPAGADDPTEGIAAPAAADSALAVGSVGVDGATSVFSPRGPRRGDYAAKPDLGAVGEAVVGARASGTPVGDADPVDDLHTRVSGTATAAAQVAAAGAVLAQDHPQWSAARLKAALMSAATPTASVFDQGAGVLDLARARRQRATAGGSAGFGFLAWPHPDPVSRTVTYRNDGGTPITLDLAVGAPFRTPGRVTVPARGTAGVRVTLDPRAAGSFGERLTATAAGLAVQTAVVAVVEPESYDLRVRLLSRPGQPAGTVAQVVDTSTGAVYGAGPFTGGVAVVRLPKGAYDVNALDLVDSAVTLVSAPGTPLRADREVVLDASAGQPVRATVDRADAVLTFGELGVASWTGTLSWLARADQQLFAVPTGREVTDHPYAFFFRATLVADPQREVYQLAFLRRGRIPVPAFRVRDRELAQVDARYHLQGAPAQGLRADFARLPLPGLGAAVLEVEELPLPARRTEFYTAGEEVTWQHLFGTIPADRSDIEINWSIRSYRPGRSAAGWNRAPLGPAFGSAGEGWAVAEADGTLQVTVPLLSGSDPDQYTEPAGAETGTTAVSQDGVEIGSAPLPCLGAFPLASASRVTVRCTASRVLPWSVIGTAADVVWTFEPRSGTAPVFVLRARGSVDDFGRAPAVSAYPLTLTVDRQQGSPAARLTALQLEISLDDGAHWRVVPVAPGPAGGLAMVPHPAAGGFVSLRITAADAAGSTVRQTVLRAYQVATGG